MHIPYIQTYTIHKNNFYFKREINLIPIGKVMFLSSHTAEFKCLANKFHFYDIPIHCEPEGLCNNPYISVTPILPLSYFLFAWFHLDFTCYTFFDATY